MSSEVMQFGKCATLVRSSVQPENWQDGHYIALEHIDQGGLTLNGYAYGKDADSQKSRFSKGDILFGKLRPYFRKLVIAPFDGMCSTDIWVVQPKSGVDRNFLFYWMASDSFINHATDTSEGTRMPRAKWDVVQKLEIPFRILDEQRVIGNLLKTLDDRITLLRETNYTLEAIAQALFKSWFVNFDPVRGKQAGRIPEGMNEATASLFPNSFEESELGLVPKGWNWGDLTNFATFQNGYAFKTKDWQDDGNPVVKIGNVKPGIIDITGASYVSTDVVKDLERFKLRRGDLLVGMTGYVGETGLVPEIYPPAYINQRVGRISTSSGVCDLGFVYCLARNPAFKTYAEAKSHGSAQANVSGSDLMSYPCIIPSPDVLSLFNQTLNPTIDSILSNYEQAQTLAALRDTLLPRLISGQLRLQEAEALLEEIIQ